LIEGWQMPASWLLWYPPFEHRTLEGWGTVNAVA
jgi:hypothetical protein